MIPTLEVTLVCGPCARIGKNPPLILHGCIDMYYAVQPEISSHRRVLGTSAARHKLRAYLSTAIGKFNVGARPKPVAAPGLVGFAITANGISEEVSIIGCRDHDIPGRNK